MPRSQRSKGPSAESTLPLTNAIHAGLEDSIQMRINALESNSDELLKEMQQIDDYQKNNLEMLVILNAVDLIEKAIKAGYNVNTKGKGGYTLLHYATMWNRSEIVRHLYTNHAELFPTNKLGETPHRLAEKFEQSEADEMMQWAECRQDFYALIEQTRAMLTSSDKTDFTKEEKKMLETACNDGEAWLGKNREAPLNALRTKKEHIELIVEPFYRTKS